MLKQKLRMCPGQKKRCYPSERAAIGAALSYSKKRGTPLRPYFHRQCKSWHLSSKPRLDTNSEGIV